MRSEFSTAEWRTDARGKIVCEFCISKASTGGSMLLAILSIFPVPICSFSIIQIKPYFAQFTFSCQAPLGSGRRKGDRPAGSPYGNRPAGRHRRDGIVDVDLS